MKEKGFRESGKNRMKSLVMHTTIAGTQLVGKFLTCPPYADRQLQWRLALLPAMLPFPACLPRRGDSFMKKQKIFNILLT